MHKWSFGNPAKIAELWQFGYITSTLWADVRLGQMQTFAVQKRLSELHPILLKQAIHAALAAHRATGEWFHRTDPVKAVISAALDGRLALGIRSISLLRAFISWPCAGSSMPPADQGHNG